MHRRATVTVVVPCYNYGRYLRQCVASIVDHQPGIDIEVIIVDDCSPDGSVELARAIAAEDGRVRVISHETNRGHIATYNDGLAAATGEFVLLLSADDILTPGALTRGASLMVADERVGLVYGRSVPFVATPPPARTKESDWIVWPGADWLRMRCLSGYNVIASPEAMMRTSLLRDFGLYRPDLPHAGDFEMWMRVAAVADIGFLVDVDQAYYRQHAANMNVRMFRSGTAEGQLIDIRQRWKAFETVLTGVGRNLDGADRLLETARRRLGAQALRYVNYAFARGFRDFPIKEFETFAREIFPAVGDTAAGRALARRKRLGMMPVPLHPLWAPSAIGWRLEETARRWRRSRVGI